MKNFKFKFGLTLFVMGLAGIFSLLSMEISTQNLPPEVLEQFTASQLQWLSLINPAFLLILAVVFGTMVHDKVKLGAPAIEKALRGEGFANTLQVQLKWALAAGLLAGVLILLTEQAFMPWLSEEFLALSASIQIPPFVRFLYGGITEEILLRFGLMTVLVWLFRKISKSLHAAVYWAAILLSSLLFAAAHLPVVYQAGGTPSSAMILYVIIGNSIGGVIFGWLYWKKGLEASMLAHIMAHVVVLVAGLFV